MLRSIIETAERFISCVLEKKSLVWLASRFKLSPLVKGHVSTLNYEPLTASLKAKPLRHWLIEVFWNLNSRNHVFLNLLFKDHVVVS